MESPQRDPGAAGRPPKDITPSEFGPFDWSESGRTKSLDQLYATLAEEAHSSMAWYGRAKRPKSRWARVLRVAQIALVALSGLYPLALQILGNRLPPPWNAAAWATVLLVLAAALVGLDRFFGFSRGWMRYMRAQFDLLQLLEMFQIEWETRRASWGGGTPNEKQLADVLEVARRFIEEMKKTLRSETNEWIADFQQALGQLDESLPKSGKGATDATGAGQKS